MKSCPCNQSKAYADCCQQYHLNKTFPETAEQLMRSRYSAYALGLVDYIVNTTHPTKVTKSLSKEIAQGIDETEWLGLEIVKSSSDQIKDKTGKVEFVASYSSKGVEGELHENSRFKKHQGHWAYLDGVIK